MAPENPPAFPCFSTREQMQEDGYRTVLDSHGGMTLRDYFAAKALAGMCSGQMWPYLNDGDEMAKRAYLFADAMLAEREKGAR